MDLPVTARLSVALLALSATGLGVYVAHESYTARAVQPVKNDRWTVGFGSTMRADGTPVQADDAITPVAALRLALADLNKKQETLRACFGPAVTLTQYEWDAYVDLAANVGATAVCKSSIPQKLQRGDYAAACDAIPSFNKVQGRNCCLPSNRSFCGGICARREATARLCHEGIYP